MLLRDGLSRMLTDGGFEVVAAVPDAAQLLKAVADHQPELAVIDVRMPPTHTDEGIKAALVIRRQFPDVALLVLSQYVEESYATDLLSAATSSVGYLLKDRVAHVADFLEAVRRVAAGGTALDPEVVAQLLVRRRNDPIDRLTPRELQVLRLMAEGAVQQRDRRGAEGQPERGGEIRHEHLRQARAVGHRQRPPPGAGRAQIPRHVSRLAPARVGVCVRSPALRLRIAPRRWRGCARGR